MSPKALKAIKEAEDSYTVYLPIIVLMEVLYLVEKGRVNLSFHKLLLNLEESINYEIVDNVQDIVHKNNGHDIVHKRSLTIE